MSTNSKIEWTDHTFNPWIGCTKVSPACDHCYAAAQDKFRRWTPKGWGGPRRRTSAANWAMPMRWNAQADAFKAQHGRRQRVFCASLADWADNAVPNEWRADLATLILCTPDIDWLLLTKRIGNAAAMLADMFLDGTPDNVMVGATIVNQEEADRDIPKLLRVRARVRFLSMEPLLGPVDLGLLCENWSDDVIPDPETGARECCRACDFSGIGNAIDWVIVGGESGPGARPMHPNWIRSLRDQCAAAGVPFLFKQHGEWREPAPGESFDTSMGRAQRQPAFIMSETGTVHCFGNEAVVNGKAAIVNGKVVLRVGKKAAGRLLDGVEWNGVPS